MNNMKFELNEKEFELVFAYDVHTRETSKTDSKRGVTVTKTHDMKTVEVFIWNNTDNEFVISTRVGCNPEDVYDKRFGMNLAVKNLLKEMRTLNYETKMIPIIKELFFKFKKNVKYFQLFKINEI